MTTTGSAVDVDLELAAGTDPRAPGGAVTVALCGTWDHAGRCRWPHNTTVVKDACPMRLLTVVVTPEGELDDVLHRIESGLREDPRWSIVSFAARPIGPQEEALSRALSAKR